MPRWTYVLALGFWGLLALGSCRSFNDYCTEKMDCEGGNDQDIDRCEVDREEEADLADEIGCSDWYDTYSECIESESSCTNDNYGLGAGDCDDESRDLASCVGFGGVTGRD